MWDDEAVEAGSHFAFPILFESGEARAAARAVLTPAGSRRRATRSCTR